MEILLNKNNASFVLKNDGNFKNKIGTSETLIAWQWLSAFRAICALIGWILLALQPTSNFTKEHLTKFLLTK